MAARQLGIAEVPVLVARGWSDAQKRAYVIADSQLALNAGWDRELLGLELGELKLGNDVPEAPEHPVSRTGEAERTLLAETPSPRNRELCESRSFDLGCDLTE